MKSNSLQTFLGNIFPFRKELSRCGGSFCVDVSNFKEPAGSGCSWRIRMIETAEISKEYMELACEVMQEQEELQWIPKAGIKVGFLKSDRAKKKSGKLVLGECIKVKDLYRCFIPHDFLIVVYAPNVAGMNRNQLKILLHHEFLHIGMDDSGEEARYIINPHDIEEFREIIDRYGIDWAVH